MRIEPNVITPRTLAEAYVALGKPTSRAMAGATDLLVQLSAEIGERPEELIDLWGLDGLRGIEVTDGILRCGALATFAEIARSGHCRLHAPSLVQAAGTIGAIQIQNRATLGGNIMNASPAGDSLPVLLALDGEMVVGGEAGDRQVAAADFWTGYRSTAVDRNELLLGVRVPIVPERQERYRKVGTRRAQAISKVVLAMSWVPDAGGVWHEVRIALGSVAPTPIRAVGTERCLEGRAPDRGTAERAAAALVEELHPIDDVRSTAAYRREAARRVLLRMLREEGGW